MDALMTPPSFLSDVTNTAFFGKALWAEVRNSLTRDSLHIAPRDRMLLHQVGTGSVEGYLYGGFTVAVGVRAALRVIHKTLADFHTTLDFGCGAGRVIRWFQDVPEAGLCGVDINDQALGWCRRNVKHGQFVRGAASPPLPYSDNQFDLIVGISVLSHLEEELQLRWLAELHRVSRPGAVLLLSLHGEDKADRDLNGAEREGFTNYGYLYRRPTRDGSLEGLPDFYQVAYHSRGYVERVWSEYFKVIGFVEHGPLYYQDLVVAQKRTTVKDPSELAKPWRLQLPITMLETLAAGLRINADQIEIGGWVFWPDGRSISVSIWLDDQLVDQCDADKPRPDVAEAFPTNSSAGVSGFSTNISVRSLGRGPHMAWVSLAGEAFPLCATFFTREAFPIRVSKRFVRRILRS